MRRSAAKFRTHFVFENLANVDDRSIQALLREVSSDELVIALKGADEEVQEKIFSNMSKRAAELLKDDLEAKGPVRFEQWKWRKRRYFGLPGAWLSQGRN